MVVSNFLKITHFQFKNDKQTQKPLLWSKIFDLLEIDKFEDSKRDIIIDLLKNNNDCIYLPGDPWLGTNIKNIELLRQLINRL